VKKLAFIVNPTSGVLSKENIADTLESNIHPQKYKHRILYTEGPGHATQLCREQIKNGTDIIVAVGGDGSVNEVAKGMVGTNAALGIVPAGSGNGLAHHLKIPQSRKQAINLINTGRIIRIDTGSINDHLFVSIAGIGFDGLIAKRFQQSKLRGFVSYFKHVAEEYPKYKPKKYELKFDNGETILTRALFITFANSDQFGFNAPIAPGARIDDGLIDVVIAEKPQIIELPYLASLMYWRRIESSKYITSRKTKEIKIRTRRKRWVNVDGEPLKMKKEIVVRINPLSLNVIVP